MASAPFVAFLDDDDVWLPENLRPQLALLEARPNSPRRSGRSGSTHQELQEPGPPYPVDVPRDGHVFKSFLISIPQLGATLARTSIRETVGGFDEQYEGDEDWDWHLRLAARHLVGFVPVPAMLFR